MVSSSPSRMPLMVIASSAMLLRPSLRGSIFDVKKGRFVAGPPIITRCELFQYVACDEPRIGKLLGGEPIQPDQAPHLFGMVTEAFGSYLLCFIAVKLRHGHTGSYITIL